MFRLFSFSLFVTVVLPTFSVHADHASLRNHSSQQCRPLAAARLEANLPTWRSAFWQSGYDWQDAFPSRNPLRQPRRPLPRRADWNVEASPLLRHRAPPPVSIFERFKPGEIVDCRVPLYNAVRVDDTDDIAPGAIPIVVAVRDPRTCCGRSASAYPTCVFVKVFVPPTVCRDIEVDDDGCEIKLDYGKYEVEIEAEDGVIEIEYGD